MSNDSQTDLAHANIGIVCALPIELGAFLDRCEKVRKYSGGDFVFRGGFYGNAKIATVESGTGFARARRATQALIEAHTPPWILSCGFSGALISEMKVGNIAVGESIVDTHGQELACELNFPGDSDRGLYTGRILTADAIVRTVAEKQRLHNQFDAIAVDLESLAVAQVVRDHGKQFMAIRTISDDMSADLPPEILSILGSTGSVRVGAALGAIWKRPGSAKDMWRLREAASQAAERLATFLDGIITQLYGSIHVDKDQ